MYDLTQYGHKIKTNRLEMKLSNLIWLMNFIKTNEFHKIIIRYLPIEKVHSDDLNVYLDMLDM